MGRRRSAEAAVPTAVCVLTVLLLGPALGAGYVLVADMVFVPDQVLLPWMAGLGAGLPRSVPQDAVVAVLSGPVPGWLLQKAALVAALVALGLGCARLVRPAGRGAAVVAAAVAVWSPYVVERLLLGHWSLLLAVGVLPWCLLLADRARTGSVRAAAAWLLAIACASLTVTGGLLALLVSAPVLLMTGAATRRRRSLLLALAVVLQLPWAVPAMVHPAAAESASGLEVFHLRSEGVLGPLLTALGTGGAWNSAAVPATRESLLAVVALVAVAGLAVLGAPRLAGVLGRPVLVAGCGSAVVGLVIALVGAWAPTRSVLSAVMDAVPSAGVLRDGQKWLAPLLILLAVAAGTGAARLAAMLRDRTGDRIVARTVIVAAALLPIAVLPDAALGAWGRLAPVDYPEDWAQVRAALQAETAAGDVVSLPWSTFRRPAWNEDRTVLDPAPRYLTRTVVADDTLRVLVGDAVVTVPGDDPRSAAVSDALNAGRPLGPVLSSIGVRYAVVDPQAPNQTELPAGARLVQDGSTLQLWELAPAAPMPSSDGVAAVVAAFLLAATVVAASAGVLVASRWAGRRRRAATGSPAG